jgi:glutathione S-transferase
MTPSGAPANGGPIALHYSPGACSFAVHAALRQAGAPFELARVDVRAGDQRSDAYRAINPRERVPTLSIGSERITEVLAIALWIERAFPDARLFPTEAFARAHAFEWIAYMATTAQPLFRAFWRPGWFAEDASAHAALQATAVARLVAVLADLERIVAERRVLNGETLGFADFYAAVYLRWANTFVEPVPFGPTTLAYRGRLQAHPAVAAALDVEGVSLDSMKRRSDP